jgi:hypothetical protein
MKERIQNWYSGCTIYFKNGPLFIQLNIYKIAFKSNLWVQLFWNSKKNIWDFFGMLEAYVKMIRL